MSDDELERLHLLATLRTYGPAPAAFIRERANDEAAHDAFDPIPKIEAVGIGAKLLALRKHGWTSFEGDCWDLTAKGAVVLEAGLDELNGIVVDEHREEALLLLRRFVDLWRDENGDVVACPGASVCDDLLIEAMELLERMGA